MSDLGEDFKGFLLLLLCLGGVRQELSPAAAGVLGISAAAESLPKASSHPNIVWARMTARTCHAEAVPASPRCWEQSRVKGAGTAGALHSPRTAWCLPWRNWGHDTMQIPVRSRQLSLHFKAVKR